MGMYISLKKKAKDIDFIRFKSGLSIFDELFRSINIKNSNILFYQDFPIQELNKDFERVKFSFGLLESSFRKRIKDLGIESYRAGFEIEADICIKGKKFRLIFELLPRNKSQYYDIRIGILPNGYANDFEDIEKFYPKLREYLFNRIAQYNKQIEHKKNNSIFIIKRALMSEHKKEFHSVSDWFFFYSKEPEEFINNLSYGNKEVRERLLFANRQRFAEFLKNLNQFIYKMFDYAEESKVIIKEGSICIIPKDEESMKSFINKLRDKVNLSVKKVYLNKEEMEKDLKEIFSN